MQLKDQGIAQLSRRTVLKAGLLGGALLAMDACVPPGSGGLTRYRPVGAPDAHGLPLAPRPRVPPTPTAGSSRPASRPGSWPAAVTPWARAGTAGMPPRTADAASR